MASVKGFIGLYGNTALRTLVKAAHEGVSYETIAGNYPRAFPDDRGTSPAQQVAGLINILRKAKVAIRLRRERGANAVPVDVVADLNSFLAGEDTPPIEGEDEADV